MIEVEDLGFAGTVTETLPAGFSYEGSSLNDTDVSQDGQDVRFFLFQADSFTYTVTAPTGAGDYTFSGTVQDDEQDERDVGGDTDVTVEPPPTSPTATRTISPASVMAGEEVTVTVASVSYGDSGTLVETLPAGLAHVSGSGGTASGQTVTFNLTA